MADEPTIDWPGKSGNAYHYWIYPLPPAFEADPGNYVFARETKPARWIPIYVGETGDLSERFDDHHAMPCIKRNNATHIHVHAHTAGKEARQDEEADIIARWNPPCHD